MRHVLGRTSEHEYTRRQHQPGIGHSVFLGIQHGDVVGTAVVWPAGLEVDEVLMVGTDLDVYNAIGRSVQLG